MEMQSAGALGYGATTTQPATGLSQIADQISEAAKRVAIVTHTLGQLSVGIHGPRPTPVDSSKDPQSINSDSLRSRLDNLLREINRLESASNEVTR